MAVKDYNRRFLAKMLRNDVPFPRIAMFIRDNCDEKDADTFRDALAYFVDRPTVPVSFQQDSHGVYYAICSNCAFPISSFRWNYCPRCGVPLTNKGA